MANETSFPRSNECVGSSQVLSKMELTYVASANNEKYAYFAVQRSNVNAFAEAAGIGHKAASGRFNLAESVEYRIALIARHVTRN